MKHKLLLLLILVRVSAFGQGLPAMEQDLMKHLSKLNYWVEQQAKQPTKELGDSLVKANQAFKNKLLYYTSKNPETIDYAFKTLQEEGLKIAVSADRKFRIYSWDSLTGGSMHYFDNVYQYRDGKTVKSTGFKRQEQDYGGWYSEIFTLNANGVPYYLGYFNAIYSTSLCYQSVQVFNIAGGKLQNKVKLIQTKSGIKSELGFSFDFFSVVDRKERPVKLIYFDPIKKTLSIPLVKDKGQGEVTNKLIVYKFNGKYLIKAAK